ncbi:MAG TPA: SufD family Fe-S cluster assembly protein [Acidimicrobiales bacterium]|nr:SufD family Fe-S cluster assembly protein [Acidimicrobiales bacterium]
MASGHPWVARGLPPATSAPWEAARSAGRLTCPWPRHPHRAPTARALRKDPPLTTFTTDASAALDGPSWLQSRRATAAAAFAGADLPSTDEEIWRYSRIDDLSLDDFAPAAAAGTDLMLPAGARALVEAVRDRAATVVVANGRVVAADVDEALVAKGVRIGAAGDGQADLVGAAMGDAPDAFVLLHDAFVADVVVVDVPAGVVLPGPVVIVHVTAGDGVAAFPHLVVRAGDDSEVSVLEVQASDDSRVLVVPVTEIVVGRAARVGHVTAQQLGMAAWQLGVQVSRVGAEASLRSASIGFGGEYARLRTDCRMVGRGATGELDAIYFGEGDQTLDFRTFQDHIAPDCTSNLLFKGAGGGRSRSVYTGMIRVGKQARGTNAFQTNRNVKLSDGAWAESVPNLVIENNDVRCSHASAVGPVDEEQRFYLESRGVPTEDAERLIVTGFFDEVLTRLPVPGVLPLLRSTVAAKFERKDA